MLCFGVVLSSLISGFILKRRILRTTSCLVLSLLVEKLNSQFAWSGCFILCAQYPSINLTVNLVSVVAQSGVDFGIYW